MSAEGEVKRTRGTVKGGCYPRRNAVRTSERERRLSSKGKEERIGNDRAAADQSKSATGILRGSPGREDLFKGDPIRWKI